MTSCKLIEDIEEEKPKKTIFNVKIDIGDGSKKVRKDIIEMLRNSKDSTGYNWSFIKELADIIEEG